MVKLLIIAFVIVLAVAGLSYWYGQQPTIAPTEQGVPGSTTAGQVTPNSSVDSDLATIDSELNATASAAAAIDAALDDRPIQQENI